MTISSNYKTMQLQIADELGDKQELLLPLDDSALSLSPIQNAIQEAITLWESKPFYFNEFIDTTGFTTSNGQEYYGATTTPQAYANMATMAKILTLHITIGGSSYPFYPRTVEWLDSVSASASNTGQPVDISIYAEKIRFYPIPAAAWPVVVFGTRRFTPLSGDTDANVWTQDAEPLIRHQAKLILGRDTLRNAAVVLAARQAIYGDPSNPEDKGVLYALRAETIGRKKKGRVRPTYF